MLIIDDENLHYPLSSTTLDLRVNHDTFQSADQTRYNHRTEGGTLKQRISDVLIERKLLLNSQVGEVLAHSRQTGLRFGEAAVSLGLITEADLVKSFGPNFGADYFYLNSKHFPKTTQGLYAVPFLLRHGLLALGTKSEQRFLSRKEFLNIGLLDPSNHKALIEAETLARAKHESQTFGGIKVYQILADQFLEVLRVVYGVSAEDLLAQVDRSLLDQTLRNHLREERMTQKTLRSA